MKTDLTTIFARPGRPASERKAGLKAVKEIGSESCSKISCTIVNWLTGTSAVGIKVKRVSANWKTSSLN